MTTNKKPLTKEHIYYVKGMHCASCEILIEKKFLEIKGVKSVDASAPKGRVLIEYVGKRLSAAELNRIFKETGYIFSDSLEEKKDNAHQSNGLKIFAAALAIIIVFLALNKFGIGAAININAQSALPAFFFFGVLAGLSSCAALVGGIVLSMSKQWLSLYSEKDSFNQKIQPHFMFNVGRLISFALLGGILGGIGSKIQISFTFTSMLVIGISLLMFLLALQMLGVKKMQRFQIALPKFITRLVSNQSKLQGRYAPFLMGAFTFLLPCGFTISAESVALLSGSVIQGGLIMLFFALGTFFPLLAIGLSSVKFFEKTHLAGSFLKVAGILVLFFALFNINSQLNILGLPSLNDLNLRSISIAKSVGGNSKSNEEGLAPVVDGKQVLKMNASASGYSPKYFKVRAGVPVRWEITDTGTSGCTNAVISKNLFDGAINLTLGQTSIKEFTPEKPGKYKFSCWMGMISGIIEVIDSNTSAGSSNVDSQNQVAQTDDNSVIPSGAAGCGCGGGNGGR